MYVSFNPNPKQKRVGDCVVRAICKVTNQDWNSVYTELCLQGLQMSDMPSSNSVWSAYLRSKGFVLVPLPNTCPDCYTVGEFCQEHPEGTYVVGTGSHAVAVIDGNAYDAWDSTQEVAVFYFVRR